MMQFKFCMSHVHAYFMHTYPFIPISDCDFVFFQKCGVHPKCHVVLSNFSNTLLPSVIWTRGWDSLMEELLRCPIIFIQEFYSNIHGIDTPVPQFATTFRGTRFVVAPDLIFEVLHVPRVLHPDYLDCECLRTVSREKLLSHFCE